mgnify:CR=1 FL=1
MIGAQRDASRRWWQLANLIEVVEGRLARAQPCAQKHELPAALENVHENSALLLKRLAVKSQKDVGVGGSNLRGHVFALAIKFAKLVTRVGASLVGFNERHLRRRGRLLRDFKFQRNVKHRCDRRILRLGDCSRSWRRAALAFAYRAFSAASCQHSEHEE